MTKVKRKITVEYLTEYAERFLADNYGFKLAIPIKRNNRLTRSLGRYLQLGTDHRPLRIELSGRLLDYGTEWAILDTLKHELIHYAVHCLGEDNRDGSDFFEAELRKQGVGSTNTITVGKYYVTACVKCGKEIETMLKRQITHRHMYRTRCCGSRYEYIGDVIYDGIERKEMVFS